MRLFDGPLFQKVSAPEDAEGPPSVRTPLGPLCVGLAVHVVDGTILKLDLTPGGSAGVDLEYEHVHHELVIEQAFLQALSLWRAGKSAVELDLKGQ